MSSFFLDPPPLPQTLDAPPVRGNVLVVSPHADDEVVGPGGTLLLHRRLGDRVHVVVVTDGANDGNARSGADRATVRAIREQESRTAAERLGATVEFLGFPDGARAREEDLGALVPRLVEVIRRVEPAVVYAPHQGEVHGDHHVTAIATRRAVAASGLSPELLGFEVWSALVPDFVVDVSDVMDEKFALARIFESQTRHADLAHFFGGLNAYRAVLLPAGARHAEAFQRMTPDEQAR
jgi:LmbE family N-acetylglucosaminyl deacetylase